MWLWPLLLLLSLLQITLVPTVFGGLPMLDLVITFVVGWSVLRDGKEAMLLAFVGGLIVSQFSTTHFGFLPLFFVLIAYLSSLLAADRYDRHPALLAIYGILLMSLYELLIWLSALFSGLSWSTGTYFFQFALVRILANTGMLLIIFPLLRRLVGFLYQPKIGISGEDY